MDVKAIAISCENLLQPRLFICDNRGVDSDHPDHRHSERRLESRTRDWKLDDQKVVTHNTPRLR
jgi:hypothetical protein